MARGGSQGSLMRLSVDQDGVAPRRDRLAGKAYDPLHEIGVGGGRVGGGATEDDDVAPVDRVADLQDDDAVARSAASAASSRRARRRLVGQRPASPPRRAPRPRRRPATREGAGAGACAPPSPPVASATVPVARRSRSQSAELKPAITTIPGRTLREAVQLAGSRASSERPPEEATTRPARTTIATRSTPGR